MRLRALLSSFCAATAGLALLVAVPPPTALAGPSIGALKGAGERPGATRLKFTAGDSVQAQVDVGSGNLLVTVRGLSLPGVGGTVPVGAFYNSAAADQTPVPRLGRGWGLDLSGDIKVTQNADQSVTYRGAGGITGVFDLVTGSTTSYVTPPGFKSQLVKTGSGWTLTENSSQDQQKFDSSGALVSRQDRNGNVTSIGSAAGANGFSNLTVTAPAGPSMARTATVVTDTYDTTTVRQDIYSEVRSVSFGKVYSNLSSFTDVLGRGTSFGYDSSGLLTSISAPGSVKTAFGYDSSRRVSSITQTETTTGGPGSSVTRLAYPSATQTLLADPNTDQALAVSAVPRTTYTIDSSQRVTQAVDAAGRTRSKAYTANFDTQSSTVGGAGGSTTTNTYGANSGQSLTKTTSPTGAAASLSYANPAGPTQFLPTSGSDDAGNAGTFTYNGAGNPLTSSDALAAKASLTRDADGTVTTATAPGNGSNATRYGYTNKQTTSITPVTGSSLAARAYTYDGYGRLATATNGRGVTTTYTYDRLDRVTAVAYTGATTVNYGYDTAGRSSTRTDAAGTATWAYDQLGRLTSRANTAGGGTITYTYDKASRLNTLTSVAGGTTTYSYDAAGESTVIAYPHQNGTTAYLRFATDSKGRRTDAWMQSNADHTTWAAHNRVDYDNSGRASRVLAEVGPGDTNKTAVVDTSYCYVAGTTAPACTANTAGDRAKLQWKQDNLSGQTTTYSYDKAGRLTKATVTGTGATTFAYSYNSNGNRLTANTQTLNYNPGNQITSTGYTYDGTGNITADPSAGAVAYTPMDQMKTVTRGASTYSYTYGGTDTNELLAQTTPDGAYTYTYGRTSPEQ